MGNVLAFCEFNGAQLRTSALANLTFAEVPDAVIIAFIEDLNQPLRSEVERHRQQSEQDDQP